MVNLMQTNTEIANEHPELQLSNFYFKMSGTSQATAVLEASPNPSPSPSAYQVAASAAESGSTLPSQSSSRPLHSSVAPGCTAVTASSQSSVPSVHSSMSVHVRPSPEVQAVYAEKVRLYAKRQEQYARLKDKPAVTLDGVPINLCINAGLQVDITGVEVDTLRNILCELAARIDARCAG